MPNQTGKNRVLAIVDKGKKMVLVERKATEWSDIASTRQIGASHKRNGKGNVGFACLVDAENNVLSILEAPVMYESKETLFPDERQNS